MTRVSVLLAMLLVGIPAQAAQLYRWVDDKGRVEWRDTPPPSTAKKVERRTIEASVIETSTAPYSVQQARRNFPLTLYVSDCGEACTKAKAHLTRRGIPFAEKNPQDDIEGYKKLTNGTLEVPMLFVGREALKGYEQGAWDAALDNAGYPRTVVGARTAAPQAPSPAPQPAKPAVNPAEATANPAAPAAAPAPGAEPAPAK